MKAPDLHCRLPEEARVAELTGVLCKLLEPPLVIYLQGDLGAGKTTFARALIQSLGHSGRVKSPSYGLLEAYQAGGMGVLHLDLYRLEAAEELEFLALRDLFDTHALLLVEWPEKGRGHLPAADLSLHFDEADDGRFVDIAARSPRGEAVLKALSIDGQMLFRD